MDIVKKLIEKPAKTEIVFNGALLHVRRDEVTLPNEGKSVREYIKHQGACAVVPIFDNGDIILLKQFRYPVGQVFIEVPAGKIDPNEPPDLTATRELEEEAGVVGDELHYVGHFYPGIGYSDEIIHIYAVTGIKEVSTNSDEDEFVEPFRIRFEEAVDWVHKGIINDGKTVICLMRTWHWWQSRRV